MAVKAWSARRPPAGGRELTGVGGVEATCGTAHMQTELQGRRPVTQPES